MGAALRGVMGASALAIFAGGACSVIVPGTLGPIDCLDEGAVGPPACPPGETCKQGMCVPAADDLGRKCVDVTDCSEGSLCVDPVLFGGTGDKRCTHPCCSSFDCDPRADFVCAAYPSGGGLFCRSAEELGRAGTGELPAGQSCKDGFECRSGLCETGACHDVCCTDTNCSASEQACVVDPAGGFACGAPSAVGLAYFDPCMTGADCASGLCVDVGGVTRCVTSCCSSSDCAPALDPMGMLASVGCRWVGVGGVAVATCSTFLPPGGTGLVGSTCVAPADCQSGLCEQLGDVVLCTDTCCSDESCGDPALFGCVPAELGGLVGLRCEPR